MQALVANMMYSLLYDYIGMHVSCIVYENGEYVEYRGILGSVLPFNGITIDEDFIPFDLTEQFIKSIVSLEDNKSLYLNVDCIDENYVPFSNESSKMKTL